MPKYLDLIGATYLVNKIAFGILSPKYSTSATYAVGDYCLYTKILYRCKTAITVGEAFTAAKWQATTVKGELKAINTNLNGIQFQIVDGELYYRYPL